MNCMIIKSLRRNFLGTKKPEEPMDYENLKGMAKEVSSYALKGEIPSQSENGFSIATFAGGCFWGVELAFQRHPGVVETCVGYTQGHVCKKIVFSTDLTIKPSLFEICYQFSFHH